MGDADYRKPHDRCAGWHPEITDPSRFERCFSGKRTGCSTGHPDFAKIGSSIEPVAGKTAVRGKDG